MRQFFSAVYYRSRNFLFFEKICYQDYRNSYGEGRICNIEGRPVKRSDREINEIHNLPIGYPVDKIPEGTAQNER